MKYRRAARALPVALTALLAVWGCSKGPTQNPIETGLLPQVPVKGWPAWSLEERMKAHGVPGVSIAVFDDFKPVFAQGYGIAADNQPVGPETLFQAGNLGALVTVVAAFEQVEAGKLSLDGPIDASLSSWQVPPTGDPAAQPLTLRQLLSNVAGVSVGQLPGYESDDTLPTLAQMLRGQLPANTPPVRRLVPPGQQAPPTPGGYLIVQQALEDVTGKPFAELAEQTVLAPLGMTSSTFAQPLPADRLAVAAAGHLASGAVVPGKGRLYPELAASGLWTTPSDLVKLLIEITRAAKQGSGQVLSPKLGVELLRPAVGSAAAGVVVFDQGGNLRLASGGSTQGFYGRLVAYPDRGTGAVVLVNSDNGRQLALEIFQAISRAYGWPLPAVQEVEPIQVAAEALDGLAGRYAVGADGALVVRRQGDHLEQREVLAPNPDLWSPLVPIAENVFVDVTSGQKIAFEVDRRGQGTAYTFQAPNGQEARLARIADGDPPRVRELLESGRVDEAIAAYRELPQISEQGINLAGYGLLNLGKLDAAVAVFELNAELHPTSANAFDSLADGHLARGDRAKALAAVQKVAENLAQDTTTTPDLREVIRGKVHYLLNRLGG